MTLPPPYHSHRATSEGEPAWRQGKCLACLGRGMRRVYRLVGRDLYRSLRVVCEECGGTGYDPCSGKRSGLALAPRGNPETGDAWPPSVSPGGRARPYLDFRDA